MGAPSPRSVRPVSAGQESRDPRAWSIEGLDVPDIVLEVAAGDVPELAWHNELGGLCFRLGERYLKWNPRSTGIDLHRERVRLTWLEGRHPAPVVLDYGDNGDAQWMLTVRQQLPSAHSRHARPSAGQTSRLPECARDGSRDAEPG